MLRERAADMPTHPIVNGVQLTDAQERRIRQIDYLLKHAVFVNHEDAVLASQMVGNHNIHTATKGSKKMLFGPQAEIQTYVDRDNQPSTPPKKTYYRDPYDRYHQDHFPEEWDL